MAKDKQIEAVLEEALKWEEASYELYTNAMNYAKQNNVKELLEWLADEELKHKQKILEVREKGVESLKSETGNQTEPVNLGLLDTARAPEFKEGVEIDVADILKLAAERERRAHEGYKRYAEITTNEPVKELLFWLASEELKHKEKIEKLYEEIFYEEF